MDQTELIRNQMQERMGRIERMRDQMSDMAWNRMKPMERIWNWMEQMLVRVQEQRRERGTPRISPQILENMGQENQNRAQHRQKVQKAAQRLELKGPAADTSEGGGHFRTTVYGEIAREHNLDDRGLLMLSDILQRGIDDRVSSGDRNSSRYQ